MDWLMVWGVTQAAGFAFKPILEDLAKDATKDWAKDIFKKCLSNVIKLPQKEPIEKAAGKALKEFLELFQLALEDTELEDEQVKEYLQPLKQFIGIEMVRENLGRPFENSTEGIDIHLLNQIWCNHHLRSLPDEFNWHQLSKRYSRKIKLIIQEEKELRESFNYENLDNIAGNVRAEIRPEYDLISYQETLRERYKYLTLDGLDHSIQDRRIALWNIFIPQNIKQCQEYLPSFHELPKEYQLKLKESSQSKEYTQTELEKLQQIYANQISQPILAVIREQSSDSAISSVKRENKRNEYYVILGDPGSGKSTLLKYLAIRWAGLSTKELTIKPIPLLIELRDYVQSWNRNECNNFLTFIHKSSGWIGHLNQYDLHQTLTRGNALVMFDGLDEVFEIQQRKTIIKQIHDLTQDYPHIQVIVTSRIVGYEQSALRNASFTHYMIQDLDKNQIEEFSEKWHSLTSDNAQEKQRNQERLKRAIENSIAIKELAGNPLLLTMMAVLNRSQELPRDRAELYHQSSRVLLYQWDIGRALIEDSRIDPKTFDYKDKQAMCRQVAYFMQSNKTGLAGNIISEEDLEKKLINYLKTMDILNPRDIAKVMIHQLRHRNFILCSLGAIGKDGYYGFVHRTFLEYFCAWEFVWKFEKERKLSLLELKIEIFENHCQDENWHEVLRLICGMIDPKFAIEIIEHLMNLDCEESEYINVFLSADCLFELRSPNSFDEISSKIKDSLKEKVRKRSKNKDIYSGAVERLIQYWEIDSELISLIADNADNYDFITLAKLSIDNTESLLALRNLVKY